MLRVLRVVLPVIVVLALAAPAVLAADPPYERGPIYTITFVRTDSNTTEAYLEQLSSVWWVMMAKAKEKGYIEDYMVLAGEAANEDDFDLMLITVFKNWAAFDTVEGPMRALEEKMFTDEEMRKRIQGFEDTGRVIMGSKTMQLLELKAPE